jgi:AcrR family transcriptional regulator
MMPNVKKQSSRQVKAAVTRGRMLRAAYELFCEFGFRASTMEAIAERAAVAVQTLYFTFHTKDELLQAVHDWTILGDDPTPPPLQSWYLAAAAEPESRRSLAMFVEGVSVIGSRVAPMLPVFHAVSADPAGAVHRHSESLRREGFEEIVGTLCRKAPLRKGLTRQRAADLLFVLAGPESYRSFVIEAGWASKEWTAWVGSTLAREFFGP